MTTLANLRSKGWIPVPDSFATFPCDVCSADATFTRMTAPDCDITALAGVGGASSDVYGTYCNAHDADAKADAVIQKRIMR